MNLLLFIVIWSVVGFLVLFNVARYGPLAHLVNAVDRLLAALFVCACNALGAGISYLSAQISVALTDWMTWPRPATEREKETPHDGSGTSAAADPAIPAATWPVWDLLASGPLLLMLWLMLLADVIFAGLRATAVLGLPFEAAAPTPLVFNLSVEAIAFALAPMIAFATFAMVILDSHGASPYAARPWGNMSGPNRARLTRLAIAGLVCAMLALVLFALYGAVVLAGAEGVVSAEDAQGLEGLLRFMLFIVYVPTLAGATALLWWSNWGALGAMYILSLVTLRLLLVVIQPVPHAIATLIDRVDDVLIQLLRLMSIPVVSIWNAFCAGRQVSGHRLVAVRFCARRPVNDTCRDRAEQLADDYPCFCPGSVPSPNSATDFDPQSTQAQQPTPTIRELNGVGAARP